MHRSCFTLDFNDFMQIGVLLAWDFLMWIDESVRVKSQGNSFRCGYLTPQSMEILLDKYVTHIPRGKIYTSFVCLRKLGLNLESRFIIQTVTI